METKLHKVKMIKQHNTSETSRLLDQQHINYSLSAQLNPLWNGFFRTGSLSYTQADGIHTLSVPSHTSKALHYFRPLDHFLRVTMIRLPSLISADI